MTLFEDTHNSSYSGHSSVEVEAIKPHVSHSMKQTNHNSNSNDKNCLTSPVASNDSFSPSLPVNATMNQFVDRTIFKSDLSPSNDSDNNNNNDDDSTPQEYRSYVKFDESINKLPNDSPICGNTFNLKMEKSDLTVDRLDNDVLFGSKNCPSTSSSSSSSSPNTINSVTVVTVREEPNKEESRKEEDLMSRILTKLRSLPCAGIILAMLSGIFFATAGFIVKLVPNVNPIEIVITRSFVQMFVYLPVIVYNGFNLMGAKGERIALFSRGFFGFVSFGLCYIAYRMIPLADASTIVFSAPVYVSVFACILLKEECGIFQAFTVIVTISGVLLISKPTFLFGDTHEAVTEVALRMEGTILAFISSLSAALTFVMIRKLQRTPAAVVINMFSVVSIVCGVLSLAIIYYCFYEEADTLAQGIGIPDTWEEIGWLVGNGLCGVLGQLCLTVALKIEEAGLVSLARTIDIVMAFIFQIAFLKQEQVHWTSILGAVIVCIGVCVSALRRWLKSKPGQFNTLWLILNCGQKRKEEYKGDKCTPVPQPITGLNYLAKPPSFVDMTKLQPSCNNNNNYTLSQQEVAVHTVDICRTDFTDSLQKK